MKDQDNIRSMALDKDTISEEDIYALLENVKDPEVPVISLRELGVLRNVEISNGKVLSRSLPHLYSCPAMDVMRQDMKPNYGKLAQRFRSGSITRPAWTTDGSRRR